MPDGSVFQLKDGRWRGVCQHEGKRKYVYGKTKAEAKRKLRDVQRQVEQGAAVGTPNQTVEQFLQSWLNGHVRQSCKPKTQESYEETCRNRIIPHIGKRKLTALSVTHIQQMVNTLQEQGLSQRTVQYAVGVLSRALNLAVEYGYLVRNPAEKVKVRVEKHQIVALTPKQATRLLEATEGHRLHVLYRIAIYMGLRRGELLALRWTDIDFAKHTLRVRQAKTQAGERVLPLSHEMVQCLQEHWEKLQEERIALGVDWQEHGLAFPTSKGTPMTPRNLVRNFKYFLRKTGLPDVRFHDLRHTCASIMYEAGVPEVVISKMLGHSRVSVTMDIYTHLRQQSLEDATARMEQFL